MAALKIVDEYFGSNSNEPFETVQLNLVSERMSARELIERRLIEEIRIITEEDTRKIALYDKNRSFFIQIERHSIEAKLNPLRKQSRKPKRFDMKAELTKAIEAFEKRKFILLYDDKQVEDIEEEITFDANNEITFLYLTPLKGG